MEVNSMLREMLSSSCFKYTSWEKDINYDVGPLMF